jgi:hypothetical protein
VNEDGVACGRTGRHPQLLHCSALSIVAPFNQRSMTCFSDGCRRTIIPWQHTIVSGRRVHRASSD